MSIVNNVISSTSSTVNKVVFRAYRTSTIVINANRALPYDAIIDNIGNGFDVASGKFTCPFTGTFFFLFCFLD